MKEYRVWTGSNLYLIYRDREKALKEAEKNPCYMFEEATGWSYRGKKSDGRSDEIWIYGDDFVETVAKEVPKIIYNTFGATIGYRLHEAVLQRASTNTVLLNVRYQKLKRLDEYEDHIFKNSVLFFGVDESEFPEERYTFDIIK